MPDEILTDVATGQTFILGDVAPEEPLPETWLDSVWNFVNPPASEVMSMEETAERVSLEANKITSELQEQQNTRIDAAVAVLESPQRIAEITSKSVAKILNVSLANLWPYLLVAGVAYYFLRIRKTS